jgi:two-component system, NarL family, response regulator NreC
VDDNGPVRKSLRDLIDTADDLEVIDTAANGIEATDHIRECCRLTRVIILSGLKDAEYVRRALEVGAKGYLLKDTAARDLLEGIRTIHQGKYYFSPQMAEIAKQYLPR